MFRILTSTLLLSALFWGTGCWLTKAGNYVADKSKSAYSSTKSALGFDKDESTDASE